MANLSIALVAIVEFIAPILSIAGAVVKLVEFSS